MRAHLHRRDQYERVVATVYVRKPPLFFPRRDVGLEMLRRGLAVTYEGKTGAEFGGEEVEARYREAEAEAKRRGVGLWGEGAGAGKAGGVRKGGKKELESPMEYKKRMKALEGQKVAAVGGGKA